MSERTSSSHISPSAHFTGFMWYRRGLSNEAFVTTYGRLSHVLLQPIMWLGKRLFGLDLERVLLQRHLQIDAQLSAAIESGAVRQVIEIACGLSPRGYRFTQRYPLVRYIEADLPAMAERKRQLLADNHWLNERHQVSAVDVFADAGPNTLAGVFAQLNPNEPVVVITEGLVNYFNREQVEQFWKRLAAELKQFPRSSYLTELYPDLVKHPRYRQIRWGVALIGRLTRGQYFLHYSDEVGISEAFKACGFTQIEVIDPSSNAKCLGLPESAALGLVRVVQAYA